MPVYPGLPHGLGTRIPYEMCHGEVSSEGSSVCSGPFLTVCCGSVVMALTLGLLARIVFVFKVCSYGVAA